MAHIPQALQRFEDHKDNPMVQALIRFITFTLMRSLEHVASWGVEVSDKRARMFYITFTDGTKYSGIFEETWTVRMLDVYTLPKEEKQTPPSGASPTKET